MSKLYLFKLYPTGWGNTPQEAWESCKENFDIDKEDFPEFDELDEMEDFDT